MKEIFKLVLDFASKSNRKIFLVGGFLRDLLLGRETRDFDFVPEGNAGKFARDFATAAGGSFVVLDEKNKIYRVVKKKKNGEIFNLDFSQLRGKKIEEDLLLRDFTVDAMAARLDRPELLSSEIIDPTDGMADLRKRVVRKTSHRIFDNDPLRLVRGYRLAASLGFALEKETEDEIKKKVNLIKRAAKERVRDELFKILSIPESHRYIRRLHRVGILNRIIPEMEILEEKPENYYHREGLWGHTLETLKSLEEIISRLSEVFPGMSRRISAHLEEKIFGEMERKIFVKWAAIFHDMGKPKTVTREEGRVRFFGHEDAGTSLAVEIMEKLKFSNRAIKVVERIVKHHMRPGNLSEAKQLTDRAIHRFFRDLSCEAVDTLLISLADRYSYRKIVPGRDKGLGLEMSQLSIKKHENTVRKMLVRYYYHKERVLPEPLIRGNEVMESFNLPQGPLIGKLLTRAREAQAEGKLKNKQEALQFLRKILEEEKI